MPPWRGQARAHVQFAMAATFVVVLNGCSPPSQPVAESPPRPPVAESPAPADVVTQGEALYRANCQSCHGDAHTGEGGLPRAPVHGPDGHTWHHSDRNLMEMIQDGSGEMGEMMRGMLGVPPETPRMPAWRGKLSEDEIAAILAYIKAGWTPEQRRFQRETTMMR